MTSFQGFRRRQACHWTAPVIHLSSSRRQAQADPWCGDIAQLVERFVRNEQVRGSTPLVSTRYLREVPALRPRMTMGSALTGRSHRHFPGPARLHPSDSPFRLRCAPLDQGGSAPWTQGRKGGALSASPPSGAMRPETLGLCPPGDALSARDGRNLVSGEMGPRPTCRDESRKAVTGTATNWEGAGWWVRARSRHPALLRGKFPPSGMEQIPGIRSKSSPAHGDVRDPRLRE